MLEAHGRPSIDITATPCRLGPPLSRPLAGDVIGFALRWDGQEHGVLWISGDTVLYDGVRKVADHIRFFDRAKPEPDLFLTCAERLGVSAADCYVVGDAVWDLLAARRAGMLSVGLLSGGYGEDELTRAGAFRVYRDAAELRGSLDEIGVLT